MLVRVAAMDPLADPFALRPDLDAALKAIDEAGVGVLLYVVNRGRMRLRSSFERLVLQQPSTARERRLVDPTSEALRDFGLGAQVLADLGLPQDPADDAQRPQDRRVEGFGIEVVERVPIPGGAFRRREAQS